MHESYTRIKTDGTRSIQAHGRVEQLAANAQRTVRRPGAQGGSADRLDEEQVKQMLIEGTQECTRQCQCICNTDVHTYNSTESVKRTEYIMAHELRKAKVGHEPSRNQRHNNLTSTRARANTNLTPKGGTHVTSKGPAWEEIV